MTTPPNTALTLTGVHFAWPDGDVVFDGLSTQVPAGRSGLVGTNGSGKSTLLRLIAGQLSPNAGNILADGEIGYLPQDLVLQADLRVDQHLGIAAVRAAIAAVEAGDPDPRHFETIGDDWDVESRALAELARLGLPADVLDRRLDELSGGECTLLALAALLLRRPAVLLLDEPTNNLDRTARQFLYRAVDAWAGTLLVVSHDRELLEHVERIGDLRPVERPGAPRTISWYGGGFSDYQAAVEAEQAAAEQAVTAARSDVRRQRHDLIDAQVTLARRERYGRKMSANKREPKIIMNQRKRAAQESAAKFKSLHADRLSDAKERLDQAQQRIRRDDTIRIDLPDTDVPAGRDVLVLDDVVLRTGRHVDLAVRGPERVAVTGGNGSGKTTLLHTITGLLPPTAGEVRRLVPTRLLPQRIDVLDPGLTVFQNAAAFAPAAEPNTLRARLARFLFSGDAADRAVVDLSGGERFRAALACLLLAEPAPQLLILDEPTNNLDLASVEQLAGALRSYRGALLVASHDEPFLESIALDRRIVLDPPATEAGDDTDENDDGAENADVSGERRR